MAKLDAKLSLRPWLLNRTGWAERRCCSWKNMQLFKAWKIDENGSLLAGSTATKDTLARDYCIIRRLEPGCVLRDVECMDRVLRVNGVEGAAPTLARRMHPGGVCGELPVRPKPGGNTTFLSVLGQVYDCTTKSQVMWPLRSILLLSCFQKCFHISY